MLRVEFNDFLINPVFFIEIARIHLGISKFVSLKPFSHDSFEADFCRKNGFKALFFETKVSRILGDLEISPIRFFVVTRDERFLKAISRIEQKILSGAISFQKGRKKLIKLEGKLFGYPECCVEAYFRSKCELPLETKLIIECFERGIFEDLLAALKKSETCFFPQFFTMNFYPCEVGCRRAKRIGFKLAKFLGEFEHAFEFRTMLNALYLLRTAYKSTFYNGKLSKIAKEFFRHQDVELLEIMRAIEKVDFEDFSNSFIRRALQGFP
ncbi:MAG: DUF483 domain-containing protein [Archaeoglobaceae archaeon]